MRTPAYEATNVGAGFSSLWAVAVLFHVLGAGDVWTLGDDADRIWGAALGLLAIWVLIRPSSSARVLALLAVQLIDVVIDAPLLGSHWILGGFISLTLLVAAAVEASRTRGVPGLDAILCTAGSTIRFEVVAFYSFAAFSKLNTGFFDPAVSCAVDFYTSVTPSWPALHGTGIHQAVIWGTVAMEITLPIVLTLRRTRLFGVWLGLGFHFVLALDPIQHVADFSSTMVALLVAFFAPQVLGAIRASGAWRLSIPIRTALFLLLAALVLGVASITGFNASPLLIIGRQILWWTYSITLLVLLYRNRKATPAAGSTSHVPLVLLLPVLLLLFNGAAPYLALKDGSAFNMYSNLNVGAESSNHLLMPAALIQDTRRSQVAEIVDSSDPQLTGYADRGLGLTLFELRAFTAERPDISVTYRLSGVTHDVRRAGDDPVLSIAPTWLERKVLLFRPIPLDDPAACVRGWGPAM